MRIINRKEFLAMPIGTLFRKYEPQIFDELLIKDVSYNNDFLYIDLLDNHILGDSEDTDEIYKAESNSKYEVKTSSQCTARDGLFDDDQLFAVYSKNELIELIQSLIKLLI